MNSLRPNMEDERGMAQAFRNTANLSGARAVTVNRTHRVVREHALNLREQKRKTRSLWVPLTIFSILMMVLCYAIWGVLDGYTPTPNGIPDASDQLMILLLWSLPLTAVILGLVWSKRRRSGDMNNSEVRR